VSLSIGSTAGGVTGREGVRDGDQNGHQQHRQRPHPAQRERRPAEGRGEQKWPAPVDPGQPTLVAQYRAMYQSLRTLGVTSFNYFALNLKWDPAAAKVSMNATIQYCITGCPLGWVLRAPPEARQGLRSRSSQRGQGGPQPAGCVGVSVAGRCEVRPVLPCGGYGLVQVTPGVDGVPLARNPNVVDADADSDPL